MYRRRVGEEAVQGVLDGMKGGISSSGLDGSEGRGHAAFRENREDDG